LGSISESGQSLGVLHLIDVIPRDPIPLKPVTSSVIKNKKTNKIIAEANLILLSIFFFSLFVYNKENMILSIYSV
jgi:hypothetical protein